MLDETTKAKLRDPDYLALHLKAAEAISYVGQFAWYDSNFLRRFEAAKAYLAEVRPDALAQFVDAFAPLRTPHGFTVQEIKDLFDDSVRSRILSISRAARSDQSDEAEFEAANFGRTVLWDEPYLLRLQADLLPRMSQLAGQELTTGYNFLSVYGGAGKCDPHLDEPYSMYTLDYCIEQSEAWPIYFSKPVEWPDVETGRVWDADRLKADPALEFAPKVLQPNNAVLFSGSSQWHYREPIKPGGSCSLLFFHYYPAGCENLVSPHKWTRHFDIDELAPLCDLFGKAGDDGFSQS